MGGTEARGSLTWRTYIENVRRRGVNPEDPVARELALAAGASLPLLGIVGYELSEFILRTLWGRRLRLEPGKSREYREALARLPHCMLREFAETAVEMSSGE
ncbi:MAG: hypothetical protein HY558_02745 [Euryarchaeota archaeon]|nr:hypothetical protein [Euryarchaeota archaeon]